MLLKVIVLIIFSFIVQDKKYKLIIMIVKNRNVNKKINLFVPIIGKKKKGFIVKPFHALLH